MFQFLADMALRRLLAAILLLFPAAVPALAEELTVTEAVQLALADDYTLQAIEARGRSMSELSVAARGLPDPQLRVGFANLPTDSFELGQEPMTQTVIGVRQMFPRGQTRALSSERISQSVARNGAEASDRERMLQQAVREEFTRIYLHRARQEILDRSLVVFTDLAEITSDYYASGRVHQRDLVQTRLELSRVQERLELIRQQEEEARARLAERIGDNAYRPLEDAWPDPGQPLPAQQIIANLSGHPRLNAWQHEISRARTAEELARQAYKPGFAVELAYGGRGGVNPDGSNRSDLLSLAVTMDVPLFTKNRQDRVFASRVAETAATQFARDDAYRSMKAAVEEYSARLAREQDRLRLYRENLLPQAAFNAETAFEDYQDAVGDLTTLMRARIGEYELKLDYAQLRAEEIITRTHLLYLQGEKR